MVPMAISFPYNQVFTRIPRPNQRFQDKTIIVTGANTWLALRLPSILCWGYWDIFVMPSIESYLTLLMTLFMTQLHES